MDGKPRLVVSAKEARERGLTWKQWQAANGMSTPRLDAAYAQARAEMLAKQR